MSQIMIIRVQEPWVVEFIATMRVDCGVEVLSVYDPELPPPRLDWGRGTYEEDSLETLS